jgi:hypothetical protein
MDNRLNDNKWESVFSGMKFYLGNIKINKEDLSYLITCGQGEVINRKPKKTDKKNNIYVILGNYISEDKLYK